MKFQAAILPEAVSQIKREDANRAIEAMKAIFNVEAASASEREEFETLRRAFSQMDKPLGGKRAGKG